MTKLNSAWVPNALFPTISEEHDSEERNFFRFTEDAEVMAK